MKRCEKGHAYNADRHSVCPFCYSTVECPNCGQPLLYNSCPRCSLNYQFQFVQDRERATEVPNLLVSLGRAPDGQPWALTIYRGGHNQDNYVEVVESIKRDINITLKNKVPLLQAFSPTGIDKAVDNLVKQVGKEISELQVKNLSKADGRDARCFVTEKSVNRVIGSTFFNALLSPPSMGRTDPAYAQAQSSQITGASFSSEESKEVITRLREIEEEMKHTKHLLLDLDGDSVYIAKLKGKDFSDVRFLRPFTFESLTALGNVRAMIEYFRDNASARVIDLRDQDNYAKGMMQVKNRGGRVRYSFAKHSLGNLVAGLARKLNDLHRAGKVHSDVKPQNALLTESGLEPFDSLEVTAGGLSLAHTLEWASPEQIIGRPIGPSSDIYSLALMWLKCLGGMLFGEESTFLLPVFGQTGAELKTIKLLKDPLAYIPANEGQSVTWQVTWQNFFRRCFTFDPEKRVPDGNSFASLLEETLEEQPIPGVAELEPYWGKLAYFCFEPPRLSLGWEVSD